MFRTSRGFTLIELMIVVVIVSILAAVGIPAFQKFAREARRAEAHDALLRLANLQEKHLLNYNDYATSLGATSTPTQIKHASMTSGGYYNLYVAWEGTPPSKYILVAEATGAQVDDLECREIHIELPSGNRLSLDANLVENDPDPCW